MSSTERGMNDPLEGDAHVDGTPPSPRRRHAPASTPSSPRPSSPRLTPRLSARQSRAGHPRRASAYTAWPHTHTWRPHWHDADARSSPRRTVSGTTVAVDGAEGVLHTSLRGWYGTLMRSQRARQADRLMAAAATQEADRIARARQVRWEAVVRRASGLATHKPAMTRRRGEGWGESDVEEPLLPPRSTCENPCGPVAGGGGTDGGAALDVDKDAMGADPSACTGSGGRWGAWGQRLARASADALPAALTATSYRQLTGLWLCVVLVLAGGALQVISLNFWIRQFPKSVGAPGNYTTLAVSSLMFSAFFLLSLAVYVVVERPDLRFLRNRHGARLLLCVGTADFFCSLLTIYGASHTSEVLQALFTSTAPIFTATFQKCILRDGRHYGNAWVLTAFVCIIAGVLLASSYGVLQPLLARAGLAAGTGADAEAGAHGTGDISHASKIAWSLLFFCSVIPSSLQNVVQTKYMLYFTRDALFDRWVLTRATEALEAAGRHTAGGAEGCGGGGVDSPLALTAAKAAVADGAGGDVWGSVAADEVAGHPCETPPTAESMGWRQSRPAPLQLPPLAGGVGDSPLRSLARGQTPPPAQAEQRPELVCRPRFDFANATAYHSPVKPTAAGFHTVPPRARASPAPPAPEHKQRREDCASTPVASTDGDGDRVGVAASAATAGSEGGVGCYGTFSAPRPRGEGAVHGGLCDTADEGGRGRSPVPMEEVDGRASMYTVSCGGTRIHVAYGHLIPGGDLTVKLVLLAVETTVQAVESLLVLPADALPWWGGSTSVREAATNFGRGLKCVRDCERNMAFGFLYCLSFVFTYVGAVYLDQYNVTLCSMVTQLAAPCTAIILIAYPSLNLTGDYTPWWLSAISIVLLATGTVLYTAWDQRTAEEKMEAENTVKRDFVQPHIIVETDGVAKDYPV